MSKTERAPGGTSGADCSTGGVVAHVVCNDPTAHAELLELCAVWHRLQNNSMYVDGEQSIESYKSNDEAKPSA